jgi:hypothetical protein
MKTIRRLFYGLIGFTWPIFYVFHAAGFGEQIYRPFIKDGEPGLWPPLFTSLFLYGLLILVFELYLKALRSRKNSSQ